MGRREKTARPTPARTLEQSNLPDSSAGIDFVIFLKSRGGIVWRGPIAQFLGKTSALASSPAPKPTAFGG